MPNRKLFLILAALFILSADLAPAADNFSSKRSVRSLPIEAPLRSLILGEKLSYEVFWMGIPVGLGSLEVKEKTTVRGRPAFHVAAVARTNDFLSKIYPIRDEVHSIIDAEGFYSLEFRKTVSEGRYRADERVVYDIGKKKAFYESFKNHSKKEFDVSVPVQDFLSAFYWFRLQPVEAGQSVHTWVNDEKENWDLEIRCLRRETRPRKNRGDVETFVVEPTTRLKGMLYDRGRAWVYFTVDSRRTPVRFKVATPFGPVVAVLKQGD